MGKIKKLRNLALIPTYALLAVSFLLGAMFIADYERELIEYIQHQVVSEYTSQVEAFNQYKVWDTEGNEYHLSESDSRRIRRLDFFSYIFPHMAYICSTILASFVYYRLKLKTPLRILSNAATRIAENDLDFTIRYDCDDEFGQLCDAFETMRHSLETNNLEIWHTSKTSSRLR